MVNNKIISIGVIGTGFGREIAKNFMAVDPTCKVYLSSRDVEKTKKVASEIGATGTFDTWQEMVTKPEIDLIVIASASFLHQEMFDVVVKTGKHILIEKPAALTSKEIEEMASLASPGQIVVINHEGRFSPIIGKIKELINTNQLGNILTIRCGAYLNWFSNSEYKEGWNNYKEKGGGQIYSIGTHQIDLVRYLLGMPKIKIGMVNTCCVKDPRFSKDVSADTQMVAQFVTENNMSMQIFSDDYCFGYKNFTIEVIGDKGVIIYSDLNGLKVSYSNTQPLEDVIWTDPLPEINLGRSILSKSMKYMAKALIDSIKSGVVNKNFCTLSQAKDNLKLFEKYINK